MTPANIAYIVLVLMVFAAFILVLAFTTLYVWIGDWSAAAKTARERAKPSLTPQSSRG